jgi:hypothetical protein
MMSFMQAVIVIFSRCSSAIEKFGTRPEIKKPD